MKRHALNLKLVTILFSLIAILYIPMKIILTYNNLIEISGTLRQVAKTKHRNPYFRFQLKEYACTFYNSGNGILNLFKNGIELNTLPVVFYIDRRVKDNLQKNREIVYLGYNRKYLFIDLYYKTVSPSRLVHFSIIGIFFIVLFLNVFCYYTYEKPLIFERTLITLVLLLIMIMAL